VIARSAGATGECVGERRRRRPRVEDDRPVQRDEIQCRAGDPCLFLGVCRARRHRLLPRQRADPDGAAVDPSKVALALQQHQVLAHRLVRDPERLGDLGGHDLPGARQFIEDELVALRRQRGRADGVAVGAETIVHGRTSTLMCCPLIDASKASRAWSRGNSAVTKSSPRTAPATSISMALA
jgi:hypothetical protein